MNNLWKLLTRKLERSGLAPEGDALVLYRAKTYGPDDRRCVLTFNTDMKGLEEFMDSIVNEIDNFYVYDESEDMFVAEGVYGLCGPDIIIIFDNLVVAPCNDYIGYVDSPEALIFTFEISRRYKKESNK